MSDDGGSVSEVDYTTPHSRVGASGAEDDGPGDRGDSTRTPRRAIPRRRALEGGPRRQFESPAKVEMERKHNSNSQTMIRPKRAMAIDIATLRHVLKELIRMAMVRSTRPNSWKPGRMTQKSENFLPSGRILHVRRILSTPRRNCAVRRISSTKSMQIRVRGSLLASSRNISSLGRKCRRTRGTRRNRRHLSAWTRRSNS